MTLTSSSDSHSPMLRQQAIFRQLFEKASSTYSYILGCSRTLDAVIIDPVLETADRDAKLVSELGLNLKYALNTHVHADHVTGTSALRKHIPSLKSVICANVGAKADVYVKHGDIVQFGDEQLEVRATPGHTNSCLSFVQHNHRRVFTGDALLIRGCGRTDFQQGDSHKLFHSVWNQILSLPDDYAIFVGHNYDGILESSVIEEKRFNARLTKSEAEFVEIMANLNLEKPKQIDRAVPANLVDGDGAEPLPAA